MGVAILLMLLATAHTALLQGLRRIGDLGRVTVIGAFVGTLAGLFAVWQFGQQGLILFLLVQTLANLIVARFYLHRLPTEASTEPLSAAAI